MQREQRRHPKSTKKARSMRERNDGKQSAFSGTFFLSMQVEKIEEHAEELLAQPGSDNRSAGVL